MGGVCHMQWKACGWLRSKATQMRANKSMVKQREAQRYDTKAILPPALSRGRHQHIHSLLIASIQFDLVSSQLQLQQLLIDFRFSLIQFQFSLDSVSIQCQFSVDSVSISGAGVTLTVGEWRHFTRLQQQGRGWGCHYFYNYYYYVLLLLLLLPLSGVYYSYYYC